ncbi:hypothetical protein Aduo_010062 [Ancylostoma duodenale]
MPKYESVRVPTNHLKLSNWERLCWQWENLTFHVSLLWSRWLWFLTPLNISRMGFALVMIIALKQAITHDTLPIGGLVRYEVTMDSMQMMDSRLEQFEKQQMMWQLVYQEKIQEMEKAMRASIAELREDMKKAISELHIEVEKHGKEQDEGVKAAAEKLSSFHSQMADKLTLVEKQLSTRLSEVESRIVAANDRIRTLGKSLKGRSSNETSKETSDEMKRSHAVNLASRSHGAFVVSHLTSKAASSSSVLLNLVDSVFPLETYNIAITERTHINPSEAFCFDGSKGTLTIRLWANTTVAAVEYEHDYWRDVVPISAPDRYDVMACVDHECGETILLGECHYPSEENGGPAQICEMQNRSITTDQIQVVFRKNHGQQYTCVYLLRVLNWT